MEDSRTQAMPAEKATDSLWRRLFILWLICWLRRGSERGRNGRATPLVFGKEDHVAFIASYVKIWMAIS